MCVRRPPGLSLQEEVVLQRMRGGFYTALGRWVCWPCGGRLRGLGLQSPGLGGWYRGRQVGDAGV